jgi:hypothetical protein
MKLISIKSSKSILLISWVIIAAIGRAIPHPPNVTPLVSLSLLAGMRFAKLYAITITLLSLFLSDCLLAFFQGHSIFGFWSWFTYSGFLFIVLGTAFFKKQTNIASIIILTLCSALGFWLWTNLGSWYVMYPHHLSGLMDCYIAGLPFLRNALIGDLIWTFIILGTLRAINENYRLISRDK